MVLLNFSWILWFDLKSVLFFFPPWCKMGDHQALDPREWQRNTKLNMLWMIEVENGHVETGGEGCPGLGSHQGRVAIKEAAALSKLPHSLSDTSGSAVATLMRMVEALGWLFTSSSSASTGAARSAQDSSRGVEISGISWLICRPSQETSISVFRGW